MRSRSVTGDVIVPARCATEVGECQCRCCRYYCVARIRCQPQCPHFHSYSTLIPQCIASDHSPIPGTAIVPQYKATHSAPLSSHTPLVAQYWEQRRSLLPSMKSSGWESPNHSGFVLLGAYRSVYSVCSCKLQLFCDAVFGRSETHRKHSSSVQAAA